VDRLHQPGPVHARPGHGAPRAAARRVRGRAGGLCHTATCAYADLLLPATTWGEKDGTVTNSERRISRVRAAVAPAGQARHDWAIGVQLARRLEARLRPGRPTLFPYTATPRPVSKPSGTSTANPRAAATWTSPA
jgi:assimilatory nitrate reductase catalytic subunit